MGVSRRGDRSLRLYPDREAQVLLFSDHITRRLQVLPCSRSVTLCLLQKDLTRQSIQVALDHHILVLEVGPRASWARCSAEAPEVGEGRADLVGEGLPDQDGVLGNPVEAEPHHG